MKELRPSLVKEYVKIISSFPEYDRKTGDKSFTDSLDLDPRLDT